MSLIFGFEVKGLWQRGFLYFPVIQDTQHHFSLEHIAESAENLDQFVGLPSTPNHEEVFFKELLVVASLQEGFKVVGLGVELVFAGHFGEFLDGKGAHEVLFQAEILLLFFLPNFEDLLLQVFQVVLFLQIIVELVLLHLLQDRVHDCLGRLVSLGLLGLTGHMKKDQKLVMKLEVVGTLQVGRVELVEETGVLLLFGEIDSEDESSFFVLGVVLGVFDFKRVLPNDPANRPDFFVVDFEHSLLVLELEEIPLHEVVFLLESHDPWIGLGNGLDEELLAPQKTLLRLDENQVEEAKPERSETAAVNPLLLLFDAMVVDFLEQLQLIHITHNQDVVVAPDLVELVEVVFEDLSDRVHVVVFNPLLDGRGFVFSLQVRGVEERVGGVF